jgi:hypothetical protein
MDSAGYSGTPLAKKLGIKPGSTIFVENPPPGYRELLAPIPDDVHFAERISSATDLVHLFTDRKADLARALEGCRSTMGAGATIWVSWPKKASRVPTDITEDVIREVAFPLGLVDIKVAAIDEVWSGLKLMIRKELR